MIDIILYAVIITGYALIITVLVRDYLKAHKAYTIRHNGSRYVVRDKRGRFVLITASAWDICNLGGGV